MDKELKSWIRAAEAAGGRVEHGSKHYKFYPAERSKSIVTVSATPSDRRTRLNERAQLRKSGLPV
jgi:hypothetical protein